MGIVLDGTEGKNGKRNFTFLSISTAFRSIDGSYEGTRYFETESNRGLFCRPAKVQRLVPSSGASNSSDNAGDASKAQSIAVTNSSQPSVSTGKPS